MNTFANGFVPPQSWYNPYPIPLLPRNWVQISQEGNSRLLLKYWIIYHSKLHLYYAMEIRMGNGNAIFPHDIADNLERLREYVMDLLEYKEQLKALPLQEHRDCIAAGPYWLYNFQELLARLVTMEENDPLYFCSLYRVTEFIETGGQLRNLPPPTYNGQPIALQGGKKRRTRYRSRSRR